MLPEDGSTERSLQVLGSRGEAMISEAVPPTPSTLLQVAGSAWEVPRDARPRDRRLRVAARCSGAAGVPHGPAVVRRQRVPGPGRAARSWSGRRHTPNRERRPISLASLVASLHRGGLPGRTARPRRASPPGGRAGRARRFPTILREAARARAAARRVALRASAPGDCGRTRVRRQAGPRRPVSPASSVEAARHASPLGDPRAAPAAPRPRARVHTRSAGRGSSPLRCAGDAVRRRARWAPPTIRPRRRPRGSSPVRPAWGT